MKKVFSVILVFLVGITLLTFGLQLSSKFRNNDNLDNKQEQDVETPVYTTNANYMHLSFDDVSKCFENLANNTYESLFDETFFKQLQSLHNEYGAKFSLYTYNGVLDNVPNTYADEFTNNSSWLKIGLHSNENGLSLANATYNQGLTYWNDFVANIERICGTTACIDRLPRLEYFSGSHNALFGMRDANCGALGFLSADDNRLSYYFNNDVMSYLYDNDYLKDEINNLLFLSTDVRADWFYSFTSSNSYKVPTKTNVFDELELRNENSSFDNSFESLIVFAHEWLVYDGETINTKFTSITDACRFAKKYNVAFDYAQNRTYKNVTADSLFESIDFSSSVTLANRNLKVVSNISELTFVADKSINGVGAVTDTLGRATDISNVLGGVSGKTISLTTSVVEDKTITYSLVEFKEDGTINTSGQTAKSWLNGATTLHADTEYVLIAFKNGDGTTSFTSSALSLLSNCLTIS